MTTVPSPNVHNIAIDGTFDDCQDLVKAMFADAPFRDEMHLSAVNSINWARIMAQIVYYVAAGAGAGRAASARSPSPCRPAISAMSMPAMPRARMGLPIAQLDRRLQPQRHPGALPRRRAHDDRRGRADASARAWTSRSRAISSGCCSSSTAATARALAAGDDRVPRRPARCRVDAGAHRQAARRCSPAIALDDDGRRSPRSRRLYRETGELIDPHSAIGVAAARAQRRDRRRRRWWRWRRRIRPNSPTRSRSATGMRPALPPRLADLYDAAGALRRAAERSRARSRTSSIRARGSRRGEAA